MIEDINCSLPQHSINIHTEGSSSSTADEDALNELTAQLSQFNWKDGVVDRAKRLLYSSDINENIKGVVNLKAMLCIGREEVYEVAQEVIDSGVISQLVEFLKIDNRDLQWPAAFCLTNIAAGLDAQTQTVVEAGAIDPLIRFLRHSDSQLRRQAIFCLANVAGSTPEYRILLARNPDYFSSMFDAGSLSSDMKILELICWNLRNVCLLGGPTFQDIRPGVKFLLDKILKRYWNFQHWSACVRFSIETISAVCRTQEGRAAMQEFGLIECLISILESLPTNALSITQSAFEALTWLIVYSSDSEKDILIRNSTVLSFIIERAIQGQCGAVVQELSLKCLACIAADPKPDKLLYVLERHEGLLHITGQVFLGILHPSFNSTSGNTPSTTPPSSASQNSIRECAAFIFSNSLILTPYVPSLLMKVLVTSDVVTLLLDIIEFSSEQFSLNQHTMDGLQSQRPTEPTNGPPLPSMSENSTVSALKALIEHLRQGELVQQKEDLPENPIARMCVSYDAANRLRTAVCSTTLPPKAFDIANRVLEQLNNFTSRRSSVFGY